MEGKVEQSSQNQPAPDGARGSWLVPGPEAWELVSPGGGRQVLDREASGGKFPAEISLVALPTSILTSQPLWLQTSDNKLLDSLARAQCEQLSLMRAGDTMTVNILRKAEDRTLVQTLILHEPGLPLPDTATTYEAHARCLPWPAQSLCLWKELGRVCLGLIDEEARLTHFQLLPHDRLDAYCAADVAALLAYATALDWAPEPDQCLLIGEWSESEHHTVTQVLGLKLLPTESVAPRLPTPLIPLVPEAARKFRRHRQGVRRVRSTALSVAAVYLVFLGFMMASLFTNSRRANALQTNLDQMMPSVLEMQETARRIDALNPALAPETYPVEILYRLTAYLPEQGVRLTRFEISGNRLELGGESSTAREAFDFMQALEQAMELDYIDWEDPPQPVPLPNNTTRFVLHGEIRGAFDEET